MSTGAVFDPARAWVPSVAAFRQEIELICEAADSSCPGCGLRPKNKPTGYIKHLQICKELKTPELTRLAACCWYVCSRPRDNASSRAQRPTLAEFKAEALGPVLRTLNDIDLDGLWELCQNWQNADEIPVPPLGSGKAEMSDRAVSAMMGKVRQQVASQSPLEQEEIARACRVLLPTLDNCLTTDLRAPYSAWQTLFLQLSNQTPIPAGMVGAATPPTASTSASATPPLRSGSIGPCSPSLPTTWEYLSRLPGGLLTVEYLGVKSIGGLSLAIRESFPNLHEADLAEEYTIAMTAPLAADDFVPETLLMLQTCLVRDLYFDGDNDKYLAFCYTTAFEAVGQTLSPALKMETYEDGIDYAPMWWALFKRGSQLSIVEKSPTGGIFSLKYPPRLYLDFMLQGFQQSIRAFWDYQGHPVAVGLKIKSLSEAHFELSWSR